MNPLLYFTPANLKNALIHLRTFGLRSMIRKFLEYRDMTSRYDRWQREHAPSAAMLEAQHNTRFTYQPVISIIVPVYRTPDTFLRQMIDSVTAQTYPRWELCIADGSADPEFSYIGKTVEGYQRQWPGVKYQALTENLGISGNTNAALALADGDYIALLDHDDILAPDALYEVVSALNSEAGIDVLYTDEDKTDVRLESFYDPCFKPDFNLDLLRSCNYITHFYVVRRSLADSAKGFDPECNGSQDYDFILKTCDAASKIHHIPKVLYHWRIHPASVAGDPESKNYAYDSAVRALSKHLERRQENATALKDTHFGYYRIRYAYSGEPLISVILNECDEDIHRQFAASCAYRKIEFVNSPQTAHGEFLLFLHRVQVLPSGDWIQELLGNCCRKDVGLAGCKSYYNKSKVLDAGLVFTPDGQLHSPFYDYHSSDPGYCYRAMVQQNVSLTGDSCFMIRASNFRKYASRNFLYSFPEHFSENFWNLCGSLRAQELLIVLCPQVSVISSDRRRRLPVLPDCRGKKDPYYNPNFSERKMYRLPG